MKEYLKLRHFLCLWLIFAFLLNALGPWPAAQAQDFALPLPGSMVRLSPAYNPPILKGIKVHPDDPFSFEFILDKGGIGNRHPERREGSLQNNSISDSSPLAQNDKDLKEESTKLIKYFLASLTIPEKDLWVNLSPYEKDRIIPESFGLTEMGRDLLAQDYMLKQITASLIYPEGEVGQRFWKRIYEESAKRFGTTNVPVNTFNKVWIVPDKAVVYENAKAGTAYIVESRLKVMLEEDYLSLSKHNVGVDLVSTRKTKGERMDTRSIPTEILREIIIPELTREVNEGENFSQLRQVYNSLILATWYKRKIKDSILSEVYADKNKTTGVGYISSGANKKDDIGLIYQRYLQAFKKGAYNYIKEDIDPVTRQMMTRKYFSGGCDLHITPRMTSETERQAWPDIKRLQDSNRAMLVTENMVFAPAADRAMAQKVLKSTRFQEWLQNKYRQEIIPKTAFKLAQEFEKETGEEISDATVGEVLRSIGKKFHVRFRREIQPLVDSDTDPSDAAMSSEASLRSDFYDIDSRTKEKNLAAVVLPGHLLLPREILLDKGKIKLIAEKWSDLEIKFLYMRDKRVIGDFLLQWDDRTSAWVLSEMNVIPYEGSDLEAGALSQVIAYFGVIRSQDISPSFSPRERIMFERLGASMEYQGLDSSSRNGTSFAYFLRHHVTMVKAVVPLTIRLDLIRKNLEPDHYVRLFIDSATSFYNEINKAYNDAGSKDRETFLLPRGWKAKDQIMRNLISELKKAGLIFKAQDIGDYQFPRYNLWHIKDWIDKRQLQEISKVLVALNNDIVALGPYVNPEKVNSLIISYNEIINVSPLGDVLLRVKNKMVEYKRKKNGQTEMFHWMLDLLKPEYPDYDKEWKNFENIWESPMRVKNKKKYDDQQALHRAFELYSVFYSVDSAMNTAHPPGIRFQGNRGGIDLTSDKSLSVENNGQDIQFHLDPAMLEHYQNAPGFVPVINKIQPLENVQVFLDS